MKSQLTKQEIQTLINNFNGKNYNLVISKSKNFIKKFPNEVIFHNLLGLSYHGLSENLKAKETFLRAIKYFQKDISLKNNLAQVYTSLFEYDKAEKLFYEIIKSHPSYPNAYLNLGNQKRDLNKLDEALNLYENAKKLSPKNPIILYAIALTHRALGNFEVAIEYAKQILSIDPNFTKADLLISRCLTYDKSNWHYNDLINKIKNKLKKNEEIDLYYSLSKANEDMKNITQAYKFLKMSNNLRQEKSDYNVNDDINLINNVKKFFLNVDLEKFSNNEENKTIFVLGMPRSGTSLVEQIISAHQSVFGGGELPYMDYLIKNNFFNNKKIIFENELHLLENKTKINYVANEYLRLTKYLNTSFEFFLDKSLLNFVWIGFIKLLFPNAKIIHCKRDPKNNCLSIYKNAFGDGLGFAHNEKDLVKFYKAYQDLMVFWKDKKIKNLIDINYENLINNSEFEVKKLINNCELSWDENCLKFYKNKNPIKTISAGQARKPIYKSSLNTFDKYKKYLKVIDNNL